MTNGTICRECMTTDGKIYSRNVEKARAGYGNKARGPGLSGDRDDRRPDGEVRRSLPDRQSSAHVPFTFRAGNESLIGVVAMGRKAFQEITWPVPNLVQTK